MEKDPKQKGGTDNPVEFFKSIKIPLKHVTKHETTIQTINQTAIKANKLVINTLQFIKLFCLKQYEDTETLPTITEELVNSVMKTLCKVPTIGRPPSQKIKDLKTELKTFYDNEFVTLVSNEELDYVRMNVILDYLSTEIVTMYENNIKQHYVEYLERYVNVHWEKKFMIQQIRKLHLTKKQKELRISQLCGELRKIKNDLININSKDPYTSKNFYHPWIINMKKVLIPQKSSFEKDNMYYDLHCHPQDYLPCMIRMMKEVEHLDRTIYNVFPLRSEIIPKHIKIDTTSIIHLLMNDPDKQITKSFFLTKGNLKRNEDQIWEFFFRTELHCFHKKQYTFHHMICTDGVSCSILLIRNDMIGKHISKKKITLPCEQYIDELETDTYERLKTKKFVAIDPNMGDLLYCVDGTEKTRQQFRYTQDQRRKETKSKKYQKIQLQLKIEVHIGEHNVIELETELSDKNQKTLNYELFKEYVKAKNLLNQQLFTFYETEIFRKLKLNGYLNRQASEQKMIRQFIEKFGDPAETFVCIGDFEQKQHMKYKEPVKGKGFRDLFRRNGFEIYLINEFRTSCRCFKCHGECRTFRSCNNPRPWRKDEIILRHGLIMCQTCKALWNRDENSSCNMYRLVQCAIQQQPLPNYLCREKKHLSETTSVLTHPKFTLRLKRPNLIDP